MSFCLGEPERFSRFREAEANAFDSGEAGGGGQRGEDMEDGEEAGMSEAVEESQGVAEELQGVAEESQRAP